MATGALDANGIWQYGEDDSETTFSGLLNKLASSVSTQVGKRKILQLKSATYATEQSTTSTAFVGSGLTVKIKPSSTTSKIYIIAHSNLGATGSNIAYATLYRNTTNLGSATSGMTSITTASTIHAPLSMTFLDSPATLSEVTYTAYYRSATGASVTMQYQNTQASITVMEVAA